MLLLRILSPSDFWSLVHDLIFIYENLYNLLFFLTFLKFYHAECGIVSSFINSLGHLVSPFNPKLMSFNSWKFTWIILLIIFFHCLEIMLFGGWAFWYSDYIFKIFSLKTQGTNFECPASCIKKKKKKFCLFFFAHSLSFHNLFSKLSIEFLCFGSHVFNFRKFLFVFYFLCHILLFFSLLDAVSPLLPVAFSCLWVCSSLHSLLEAFLPCFIVLSCSGLSQML